VRGKRKLGDTNSWDKLLLPEEQVALELLSDGILADINARLSRVIRRLGLKRELELFMVEVVGLQLAVQIDDETREYLLERRGKEGSSKVDSDSPNYYA
jgi:hypothetical protein